MAPKISSKLIIIFLVLALGLPIFPHSVSADAPAMREHVIKFYLDPALVPDVEFAKTVLVKYVDDMNTVLAKNTVRRFVFDPETGLVLTASKPHTDSGTNPLPTDGFEIWVVAKYTDRALSYGGYAGMDKSGAGVLAGFNWTRIYNPETLSSTQTLDYIVQINNMLHELGHVFGAGIGEYYSLATVNDTTAAEPLQNIRLSDSSDGYWSDKPDFLVDPLLRLVRASSREEFLSIAQFSSLTASVLNNSFRNGLPALIPYAVQVLDSDGMPVPDATVKVWNVRGYSPYENELLFETSTDEFGMADLSWGGTGSPRNAGNFLRLIKVYKDGQPLSAPRYISIFDMDIARLVHGLDALVVTMQPQPAVRSIDLQPQPQTQTAVFTSTPAQDGWVLASTATNKKGGTLNASAATFNIGDNKANRQYRAILSFDTSSLPEEAVITKVTLKVKQKGKVGADPMKLLKGIRVDMQTGAFGGAAGLQAKDFQAAVSKNGAGWLLGAPVNGWRAAELDALAFPLVNSNGVTQFRLQFATATNKDGKANYFSFFSGNAADVTAHPQLIVEYHIP